MKYKVMSKLVIVTSLLVALTFLFTVSSSALIAPSGTYATVSTFQTYLTDTNGIYGWLTENNGYMATKGTPSTIGGLPFVEAYSYIGTFVEDEGGNTSNVVNVNVFNFAELDSYDDFLENMDTSRNVVYLRWYFYVYLQDRSLIESETFYNDRFDIADRGVTVSTDYGLGPITYYANIQSLGAIPQTNYQGYCTLYQADLTLPLDYFDDGAVSAEIRVGGFVNGDITDDYLVYGISEHIYCSAEEFGQDLSSGDIAYYPPWYKEMQNIIQDWKDKADSLKPPSLDVDINVDDFLNDDKLSDDIVNYVGLFIPDNDKLYLLSRIFVFAVPVLTIASLGYILHGKR